jgi:uncharacterized membrane protein
MNSLSELVLSACRQRFGDALVALFVSNIHLSRLQCHQRSERSFFIRNRQFQICARCTGLAVGGFIGPILALFGTRLEPAAAFSLSIFVLDGATQLAKWRTSTNVLRFGTGVAVGSCAVGTLIQYVVRTLREAI